MASLGIRLVRSAMTAFYPRTDRLPGISDMDLEGFLTRFRREAPGIVWLGLLAGSLVFAISPVLTIGRPVPAFLLDGASREIHAARLCGHRVYLLRQCVFLVKMIAGLHWGSDPRIRETLKLPAYPVDPGTWRTE